jgi:hypothetical protein
MVDENEVGIECGAVLAQFLCLAGTDEVARIGTFDARRKAADDARAGRARQFGEFDEGERIGTTRRLRLQQKRALAFSGSLKQGKSPACCGHHGMRPAGRIFKGARLRACGKIDILSISFRFARPVHARTSQALACLIGERTILVGLRGCLVRNLSGLAGFLVRLLRRRRCRGTTMHDTVRAADAHVARRHDSGDRVLVDHLAHGVAQQDHELVERLDRALQLDPVHQIDGNRDALTPQRIQKRILQRLPLGHGLVLQ